MAVRPKHVRFEIPEPVRVPGIDLGPIIDPPFTDGISREAPDCAANLTDVEYEVPPDVHEGEVAARAPKYC